MVYSTYYISNLCRLMLASDGKSIIGLWMEGQKYFKGSIKEDIVEKNDLDVFNTSKRWLDKYFNGEKPSISDIPLSPRGSNFRKLVWEILCEIPYGEVMTYGNIAKKVAIKMKKERMSSQAVGGAVGHNPISIIIPCHRVIGTNGSLTGFAGGIDKKIKLLKHEGIDISKFSIPEKGTAL